MGSYGLNFSKFKSEKFCFKSQLILLKVTFGNKIRSKYEWFFRMGSYGLNFSKFKSEKFGFKSQLILLKVTFRNKIAQNMIGFFVWARMG